MNIPDPHLWRDEQRRGLDEGQKERPCAIVLAVAKTDGAARVVVAAITHAPPAAGSGAISIPPVTAKRLGLDEVPQWIVTHELNIFTWPGPDIRPAPGSNPTSIAYGQLPQRLTTQLINQTRAHIAQRRAGAVERDDTPKT